MSEGLPTPRTGAPIQEEPGSGRERGPQSVELSVDSKRLARGILVFCILAEIAFVALDYHVNYGKAIDIGPIRRIFNIAREDGLASWFGTTQTLLAGLTLWLIYLSVKHQGGLRWRAAGWLVLALFFTYMAVDDGAQLHERLGSAYQATKRGAGSSLGLFPSYTWQLVFLPFFGALGLFTFLFLWQELRATASRALLVVAISCLVLAVGLDFVEGLDRNHRWNLYSWIAQHRELEQWSTGRFAQPAFETLRHFSKSVEEAIEMLANSILWFLFLRYLSVSPSDLRIRFRAPGPS